MPPNRLPLSIVTPSFNRSNLLPRSVASALAWLGAAGGGEVIIVDDCSTDGTETMVHERFGAALDDGRLQFHRLSVNQGTTAAKNEGVRRAKGEWVLFLDSDDHLIVEAAGAVMAEITASKGELLNFRCRDSDSGRLIGTALAEPRMVGPAEMLTRWPWGDCLPIVRRATFLQYPFIEDLRGFEGIAWARIAAATGPLRLLPIVALAVDTSGDDRISANLRADRCRDARALSLIASEFGPWLGSRSQLRYRLAAARARFDCWRQRRH